MIAAFDTATHKVGYCILAEGKLLTSGVWRLGSGDLNTRLGELWLRLEALYDRYPGIEWACTEVSFVHPRLRRDTAIILGHAAGVIKGWAFSHGLTVVDVVASTAKKALTGSGRATKFGVQEAVRARFGLEPQEDEADAIAVAWAAWCMLDSEAE